MKSTLLDLSGKIEEVALSLYETLSRAAGSLGLRFFVVGAAARDMILAHGYGRPAKLATVDVDIGLCAADWAEFKRLKEALLATNDFKETKRVHALLYREVLPVDIIPYGAIAGTSRTISWPPDQSMVMSVAGFDEAYEAAQVIRLRANPPLDVPFASPVGLALMKIVAWGDRASDRDALDLDHLIDTYLDLGNFERLLDDHAGLLESLRFDNALAGSRLLGRDIGRMVGPAMKNAIVEILERETAESGRYLLVRRMMQGPGLTEEEDKNSFEVKLALLRELLQGIREPSPV